MTVALTCTEKMDLFSAPSSWKTLLLVTLSVALVSSQAAVATDDLRHASQRNCDWPGHGGPGLANHREAFQERKINPKSVLAFEKKWEYITGADVTATPAVSEGVVYFPSWNGNLYAVSANTGHLVWEKNLTALKAQIPELAGKGFVAQLLNLSLCSRSTPVVVADLLLIGLSSPAAVIAVKKASGALVWSSLLDPHPYALITMSGTAFEGSYFVGTSSLEEIRTEGCCTFQGAFFKLKLATGEIIFRVAMAPENGGKVGLYSGNAVWGSNPPIDTARRLVYVATGNAYSTPPAVTECRSHNPVNASKTDPSFTDPCVAKGDYTDAIVAICVDTGKVVWAKNLGGSDVFVFACAIDPASPNCPGSPGEDYDFGESPMLLTVHPGRDIVVVGQKSGFIWALDRSDGAHLWVTVAGPGGNLGGSSWGMTTDGKRVFTNIINNGMAEFELLPSREVVQRGGWVAVDAATGSVLWSTANPDNFSTNPPMTHANGVVFGGSNGGAPGTAEPGRVVALDAKTGHVLWTYPMPGPMAGGVSVVDGVAYVGSGTNVAFLGIRRLLGIPSLLPYLGKSVLAFSADYR